MGVLFSLCGYKQAPQKDAPGTHECGPFQSQDFNSMLKPQGRGLWVCVISYSHPCVGGLCSFQSDVQKVAKQKGPSLFED